MINNIELIRRDSLGIKGTYRNIKCHAHVYQDAVEYLETEVKKLSFDTWRQGHNVHLFVTKDGRQLVLRPLADGNGYRYIVLLLRVTRSKEVFLCSADCRHPQSEMIKVQLDVLVDFMRRFAATHEVAKLYADENNRCTTQDNH